MSSASSANAAPWINFKELRSSLDFRKVIAHYQLNLRILGDRATGICPLPTHAQQSRSRSFSANLDRGIWQCFKCHAKGNVLDFAVRMEGFDPTDRNAFRQGALRVADVFRIDAHGKGSKPPGNPQRPPPAASPASVTKGRRKLVNPPLDFTLKNLDVEHPYFGDIGLTPETVDHFGLGYANRGLMKYRVAIPLHDVHGQLIGYAGALTDSKGANESNPLLKFPTSRERDGVTHVFDSSLLVYHVHQVKGLASDLVVVSGFRATWRLWLAGYEHVVGLFTSACSKIQANTIGSLAKADGRIWIVVPGSDPRALDRALRNSAGRGEVVRGGIRGGLRRAQSSRAGTLCPGVRGRVEG